MSFNIDERMASIDLNQNLEKSIASTKSGVDWIRKETETIAKNKKASPEQAKKRAFGCNRRKVD